MPSEALERSEHLKLIMESMEDKEHEHEDRFKIIIALLLGLVTVLVGLVSWRVAVSHEHAGVTDLAGLSATINSEETRVLNTTDLYEQYRAYTAYVRDAELATQLSADLKQVSPAERDALKSQMEQTASLAAQNQDFFSKRYLTADGAYDSERALSQAWADAARVKDINPQAHFTHADELRENTKALFGILILLAGAFWFYTLAEILNHNSRYLVAVVGGVLMASAVIALVAIEFPA
jgi:hypothetical protein